MAVSNPGLGTGHTASAGSGRAGRPSWSRSRPARGTAPPSRSTRRLPLPMVRGVVSSTASLPRALLQDSRPGVVSSDSVSVSLDLIFVKDPGSLPSSCWTSPSSGPNSPRSLPASSDSVGVMSLSGVVPLVWGRRMVDGSPSGCPSPRPWYRPYCFRGVRTRW